MNCALCSTCEPRLDARGRPTGRCIYGGPFTGYKPSAPIDEAAHIAAEYGPGAPRSWAAMLISLQGRAP